MTPQRPVLVTPPAELPVTVGDVKAQCRVDSDDDDATIADMIAAAVSHLDGYAGILGRCMVTQTWSQSFDEFPDGYVIRLPFPNVSAVTVTYRDADDASQTFTGYRLATDAGGSILMLNDGATWPDTTDRPDAVTVQMTAGYGAATAVPPVLRHAVKTLAAAMYEGREGQMTGSPMFDAFVAPFRHHSI
jgi:uncharacterized phiE125 gp8 family phage protein